MANDKTRSGTSSRALRRLEPYKESPGDRKGPRNRSRHGSPDSTREQVQMGTLGGAEHRNTAKKFGKYRNTAKKIR